jgi:hypothetical protein
VVDDDETPEFVRKMNAELRGDTAFPEVQRLVSQLWESYAEARDQPGEIQRLRSRYAGMQDAIARERLNAVVATRFISHGVSISRTAASLEEARLLLEADPNQVIAVAAGIRADPATAGALDDASDKLRKAGAANLNSSVLLLIVFVLISIGLSIGQAQLPGEVQTITLDTAANLALALAISDHIKRNKSS